MDECIEHREAAFLAFDECGENRRAGQCAVWLYEHHCFRAQPSIGGAWLRRARQRLDGDAECTEYGNLVLREAEAAHGRGDLDLAAEHARQMIELGRRLRSPDLEAGAQQTLGRLLVDQGRPEEGLGYLDEAMLSAVEGRLESVHDRQGLLQPDQRLRGAGRPPAGGRVDRRHGPVVRGPSVRRSSPACAGSIGRGPCSLVVSGPEPKRSRSGPAQSSSGSAACTPPPASWSSGRFAAAWATSTGPRRRSARPRRSAAARRPAWPCCDWPRDGSMRRTRSSSARSRRRPGSGWRAPSCCRRGCRSPWPAATSRQLAWRPPSSTPSRPSSVVRRCSRPPPRRAVA